MRISLTALVVLAAVIGSLSIAAPEGYMVESGRAKCVIVIPNDATPGEKYAAEELRKHIKQITGVELTQIPESQYSADSGPCISIGRTALSEKYVSDDRIAAFGDDGYRVFTRDGNTFFVGGRKRGSLYAVYEYLESLGVRWYSPDYTSIPKTADVKMPTEPFEFTPKFWYRDQWWNNGATNTWLARMRVNGSNGQNHMLPDDMGESVVTMHSCHSFETLVPPAEHFDKNPEWFAVKEDGRRSRHELCLVNSELCEFVVQRVMADLESHAGQIDNYWVSQNDGGLSGCFCDECTAERLAHGGRDRWSANTISFASYVADRVKQQFPKVRIKTLAYSYTLQPPTNLSASENLLVEICGNFRAEDDAHAELVRAWSKTAENISVYTYGGSNYGYWWPYPNVWEVGMQYPWALKSGVTAIYIQGTALGRGSGLVDMKAYISARMAWDPSRDVKKEIQEFCEGFYGPGGRYIVEYLEWYSDYIKRHDLEMEGGWGDSERWRNWVTREAMDHCDGLFQKAITATEDKPVYLKHVRRAYLEVLWGTIMISLTPGASLADKELSFQPNANGDAIREKAKLFGEIMRENGYDMWSEIVPLDADSYPH